MENVQTLENIVDAYKNRDINKLILNYTQDVSIFNEDKSEETVKGLDDFKTKYTKMFQESPKLDTEVLERNVTDNSVEDIAKIVGRSGMKDGEKVRLTYKFENGLVSHLSFKTLS